MTQLLPQVMLLGTYHFDNPNNDYIKTNYDSILSEKRQQEVQTVLDQLAHFNPTHIAIEVAPSRMEKINERYTQYRQGTFDITGNEIYQLGFRLAHHLNHAQLYGIDYPQEMHIDKVFDYAPTNGQGDILEKIQARIGDFMKKDQELMQSGATVSQMLRFHNDPAITDKSYDLYMYEAIIGKTGDYIGAEDVGGWYTRNLKTFAEISWLATSPDARILVIIGSGHTVLLRHYINFCSHLTLVSALDYLK
ncbi:MAG TPA: DUF5694 domain-containing protein [Aggregatilineales bacterium]|nr:DUF5694 domain-containing protein [Aggregatilineales bacterium]